MNKNWFYLTPDTFLWSEKSKELIYNSKVKKCLYVINEEDVRQVTNELRDLTNLYCVEVQENLLKKPTFNNFLKKVIECEAGNIIKQPQNKPKPIVLPPILNLQSEVERLKNDSPSMNSEHVIDYLHEIFVCINSISSDKNEMLLLDRQLVQKFLNLIKYSSVAHVHIICEKVSRLGSLNLFLDMLKDLNTNKSIHVKFNEINDFIANIGNLNCQLIIEIDDVMNAKRFSLVAERLETFKVNILWSFFIKSELEYELAEFIIEKYNLENTEIKPVFTGGNLPFFEDNIYLTEEDLQEPNLSKREVFAHQALNTNDFGKLTIMPDGEVYANPYFPALGTIDDDIRELIYKEMTEGKSWLRIRDMEPCCDCVYQWLCPSPSNYELAIGKPNLCHVKP